MTHVNRCKFLTEVCKYGTSSVAAQSVLPAFAVYAGTKAYVSLLSRNLRAELGAKKVRVSVIEPGLVDTELQHHVGSDEVRAALEGLPPTTGGSPRHRIRSCSETGRGPGRGRGRV
jgi:NAD(P)-dependent dehydrogenase (short-subunit alcohol dehydrogenase family)